MEQNSGRMQVCTVKSPPPPGPLRQLAAVSLLHSWPVEGTPGNVCVTAQSLECAGPAQSLSSSSFFELERAHAHLPPCCAFHLRTALQDTKLSQSHSAGFC